MDIRQIATVQPFLKNDPPAIAFTGVQCDSRLILPGQLFVAINGTHENGSRYAQNACARGAVAVVAEAPIRGLAVPVIEVTDARQVLGILAAETAGNPSEHLALYGITGTNGKTTTAWILSELLKANGAHTGLITTVQTEYGERTIPSSRTTPDACSLQKILGEMVKEGCDAAVMEVSSHALDQQRIAALRFAGAIFTHLTQDHLDYHHTFEAYFAAKQKLFVQLSRLNPGAPAVTFLDAPYGPEMTAFIKTLPLRGITCGFETPADLNATHIQITADGCLFTLHDRSSACSRPIRLQLAGRHNIANALCAAALARAVGIPFDTISQTLETLRPRWGRLERITTPLPAAIFVDYAHTDDALTHALETLREMRPTRLSVVFGCGGDRDTTKRPLMGRACATAADRLIVTSDNPRSEDPNAIIAQILTGIPAGTDLRVEPDRRAAIRLALAECQPGEIILIAGKGHEATQEINGRHIPFDDRNVVREEAKKISQRHTEET